jgi:hypothetical protein
MNLVILKSIYSKNHTHECGSTIILSNLKQSDISYDQDSGKRFTLKEFELNLIAKFSKAYSDIIRDNIITIKLNNALVPVEEDLVSKIPSTNIKKYTFYIKINAKNEAEEIYRLGKTPTGRPEYRKYNISKGNFSNSSASELDEFKSNPNVYTLELTSLTTKRTNYENICNKDFTDIVRDGRCYDPALKITKTEPDGYSNHIYNRIDYKSKKLNALCGVGPNKRVTKTNNTLMSAMHNTLKDTTKGWRKFCKDGSFNETDSDSDESVVSITKSNKKNSSKKLSGKVVVFEPLVSPVEEPVILIEEQITNQIVNPVEEQITNQIVNPVEEPIINEIVNSIEEPIINEIVNSIEEPIANQIVNEIINEIEEPIKYPVDTEIDSEKQRKELEMMQLERIEQSRESLKIAAKILMELSADPNFNRQDGERVLNYIYKYNDNL